MDRASVENHLGEARIIAAIDYADHEQMFARGNVIEMQPELFGWRIEDAIDGGDRRPWAGIDTPLGAAEHGGGILGIERDVCAALLLNVDHRCV